MRKRPDHQDAIFVHSEGDAWFRRNVEVITSASFREEDPVLRLLLSIDPLPRAVLEVGCANGWRLAALREATGARCVGVDVSEAALRDGSTRYRGIQFARARASYLPFSRSAEFDAVVASFVFHWIDRRHLLSAASEVDRSIRDGGYLVLADFFPSRPTKVAYHHLEGSEVFTYKQDYSTLFVATGYYRTERLLVFDHEDPSSATAVDPSHPLESVAVDESSRAGAWLLRKVLGDS